MTQRERADFQDKKYAKYLAQNCYCWVCDKRLEVQEAQWAHRIPAHKKYIQKYGAKVIHHELNGRITCAGCNVKVLMDPATHPIEAAQLVEEIEEAIENEKAKS